MSIPETLLQRLSAQYDGGTVQRILAGCMSERRSALRANTQKTTAAAVQRELAELGMEAQPLPWYADGLLLPPDSEGKIRETALYRQGAVYLQNPSSMLPPLLLNPQPGEDILDACAAPGSKTTQLFALCPACSLTACEKDAVRADRLRYNLQKQGARAAVLQQDARRLSSFLRFDRILLDAPCSGSGTILASRPQTARAYSPLLVENSARLQRQLLQKMAALLKAGGTLVYSTCSIHREENEAVVQPLLQSGAFRVLPAEPQLAAALPLLPCSIAGALLVCPTEVQEGFFAVRLQKVR